LLGVGAIFASGTLVLGLYAVVSYRGSTASSARSLLAFAPAAVFFVAAYVCFVAAYERGRVVVVAPLTAAEALWTMLFAAVALGRGREGIGRRVVVACALVALGTSLVGAFH
jgi:drug/metabolite transporter (DMT)-like permease